MAISDRGRLGRGSFADWVAALAHCGVDTLQVREKDLDDRALVALVAAARQAAPPLLRIVVNGRIDIALAAGADGVHLPCDGVVPALVRQNFGAGILVGCSAHHPGEVARAAEAGADYATFGPVWDTPSKRAFGPPPGLEGLRWAAACGLPVLALGGVTPARLAAAAAAGAAGAAAIRAFVRTSDAARMAAAAALAWPHDGRADTLTLPAYRPEPGSKPAAEIP